MLISPNEQGKEHQALKAGGKKCPYCAEVIKHEARVCRFCGRDLPVENSSQREKDPIIDLLQKSIDAAVIIGWIVIICALAFILYLSTV